MPLLIKQTIILQFSKEHNLRILLIKNRVEVKEDYNKYTKSTQYKTIADWNLIRL